MNFQLIDLPLNRGFPVETSSLSTLIDNYRVCTSALEAIAEKVPANLKEAEDLEKEERVLHDRRAELLGVIVSREPNSLDDAKAYLRLWHLEKLEESVDGKMSITDDLVCKVCNYLDIQ